MARARLVSRASACSTSAAAAARRRSQLASARRAVADPSLGVDISAPMLGRARERAPAAGLANLRFQQGRRADRRRSQRALRSGLLALRRDVLRRLRPRRSRTCARALRPGARLAFVCWQASRQEPVDARSARRPRRRSVPLPAPPCPARPVPSPSRDRRPRARDPRGRRLPPTSTFEIAGRGAAPSAAGDVEAQRALPARAGPGGRRAARGGADGADARARRRSSPCATRWRRT